MSRKREIPIGLVANADWIAAVTDQLQIITGRRRNSIFVVPQPNLTFSASPTQAECQALYNYTNQVRTAVAALVMRLDQ